MDDDEKQRMLDEVKRLYAEVKDDLTDDEKRRLLEAIAPAVQRMAQRN